jgi:hypothetical protein
MALIDIFKKETIKEKVDENGKIVKYNAFDFDPIRVGTGIIVLLILIFGVVSLIPHDTTVQPSNSVSKTPVTSTPASSTNKKIVQVEVPVGVTASDSSSEFEIMDNSGSNSYYFTMSKSKFQELINQGLLAVSSSSDSYTYYKTQETFVLNCTVKSNSSSTDAAGRVHETIFYTVV